MSKSVVPVHRPIAPLLRARYVQRNESAACRGLFACVLALALAGSTHAVMRAQGQVGPNINIVTGSSDQFKGDEFRQRQNESVIGISSVNPSHMMVAYNDYRTVDFVETLEQDTPPSPVQSALTKLAGFFFPQFRPKAPSVLRGKGEGSVIAAAAQAWIGLSFSDNGGKDWYTGLHPGHPLQPVQWPIPGAEVWDQSQLLTQFAAASDPVMAATPDEFFVGGIAFNPRGDSAGFISRFRDRNDTEAGENIQFEGTRILLQQPARYFVEIGRAHV